MKLKNTEELYLWPRPCILARGVDVSETTENELSNKPVIIYKMQDLFIVNCRLYGLNINMF